MKAIALGMNSEPRATYRSSPRRCPWLLLAGTAGPPAGTPADERLTASMRRGADYGTAPRPTRHRSPEQRCEGARYERSRTLAQN